MDLLLQSGIDGAPKWEPRSWLGINGGYSPSRAGSVALVLKPGMGHVLPQFHVVFDDLFTTDPFMEKSEVPPLIGQIWLRDHKSMYLMSTTS